MFQNLPLKDLFSNLGEIGLFVLILLFTAGSKRFKGWLESRHNKSFENSINKNAIVRELLSELRGLYDADRVKLYQLHNGQYYFGGDGADKCSLTNFVLARGVAIPHDLSAKQQNIPTTHLTQTLKMINENGFMKIVVGRDIEDPYLQQLLLLSGTEKIIIGPVKDRKGVWKGIIIVSWLDEKTKIPDVGPASEYALKIGDTIGVL